MWGGRLPAVIELEWQCACSGCSQGLEAPPLALGGEATGVTSLSGLWNINRIASPAGRRRRFDFVQSRIQ